MKYVEAWFPGDTKPSRSGVYKRRYFDDKKRSIDQWSYFCVARQKFGVLTWKHNQAKLAWLALGASTNQDLSWCGIVEVV